MPPAISSRKSEVERRLAYPVDEVWADAVGEYEGKKLRSVAKGQIDLDAEEDDEGEGEKEK